MHLHTRTLPFLSLLSLLSLLSILLPFALAQNGALGGGAPAAQAPTQFPTVINGPSMLVQGGSTTVVQKDFTQTFKLPLGTWAFPTPAVGSVGLGNIQGTVGLGHH